jgi:hypothetical protein
MSAHRTFKTSRSATALRSASSIGEARAFSRRQAQPGVGRWSGQPGPHEAVDLPATGIRVLAAHPLTVQLHAQVMHVQRGAHALVLEGSVKVTGPHRRAHVSNPREQQPQSARPVHASMVLARPVPGVSSEVVPPASPATAPYGNESHNLVTGLSAPLRILCHLTCEKWYHTARQGDHGQHRVMMDHPAAHLAPPRGPSRGSCSSVGDGQSGAPRARQSYPRDLLCRGYSELDRNRRCMRFPPDVVVANCLPSPQNGLAARAGTVPGVS